MSKTMTYRSCRAARLYGLCGLVALTLSGVASCGQTVSPFGNGAGAHNGATGGSGAGDGGMGGSGTGAAAGAGATGPEGGNGGGATGGTGASCAGDVQPTLAAELDLLVVADQSGSMADANKWLALSDAVQAFVLSSASDGIGVGLQYFPVPPANPQTIPQNCNLDEDCGLYGPCMPVFQQCSGSFNTDTSCVPTDYASPEEPIALLPTAADQLTASLQGHTSTGSATPTEPAMEGAGMYAATWTQAHANHQTAIVLITDGEPTSCTENTVAGAATAAAAALSLTPPVSTFVIGIQELTVSLDPIAQAGGTGLARLVAGGSQQQLQTALEQIRDSRRCGYPIPPPAQGPTNFGLVNLMLTDPAHPQTPITVPNVATEAECTSGSDGWYYDDGNAPHLVLLCAQTCAGVLSTESAVGIVHGCPTVH